MKYISKITVSMAIFAGLTVNCHKSSDGNDGGAKILLMSQQVQSAATGACGISVNLDSLYQGSIVNRAVTGGQSKTTADADYFDKLDYDQAAGNATTTADADWTAATGVTSTTINYNQRYDAFWTDKGTWTATTRKAALAAAKNYIDSTALLGLVLSSISSYGGGTPGVTALCTTKNTEFLAAYDAFVTLLANTGTDTATGLAQLGLSTAAALKTSLTGAGTCVATMGAAPWSTTYLVSTATQASLVSSYMNATASKNGAALLACSRIPRSSCSLSGVTTATLAAAKTSAAAAYDALQNNGDCRKPTSEFMGRRILPNLISGLKNGDTISITTAGTITGGTTLNWGTNFKSFETAVSTPYVAVSATVSLPFSLYASNMYPVSSALTNVSPTFAVAFPLATGTTAYDTTLYRSGSNINFKTIDSCDSIGLGVGKTPNAATKQNLTSPAEIVYALSPQNTAATWYAVNAVAAIDGLSSNDAIACNSSMRKNFSVPAALNEKLGILNVTAGDGSTTSLISSCVYGKNSATVTTVATILGSSIPQITACPTTASTAASAFGSTGLTSIDTSKFPYAQ